MDWLLLGLVYNFLIQVGSSRPLDLICFLNVCYLAGPLVELFVRATHPTRSDFYICRYVLFCGGSVYACIWSMLGRLPV